MSTVLAPSLTGHADCRLSAMTKPIPRPLWIDRCATRMGEHDAGISPAEAVEHAEDLWNNVAQELSPEVAADMAVGSIEALEHLFFHFEA